MTTFNADWEREAKNWIRFAREGDDAYVEYSPSFFELVPPPGRATLEIGCGEGRVTRDLAARGHRVTAVDASPTLLAAAEEALPEAEYVLADAADLPFDDDSFDLVVAYNSLIDIQDLPGAVREAARVLAPGGRFCVCVTHPLADAGLFEAREADARFVISGSYLDSRRVACTVEHDGLEMNFWGWSYPLSDYTRALEETGFAIEALREPKQRDDVVAADPGEKRWQRVPAFLYMRAVSSPASSPPAPPL
jgi:SAM-dependent methyltransferase